MSGINKLALYGGKPIRTKLFPEYNPFGEEEKRAVLEVLDGGVLSGFIGAWSPQFYGGPWVQKLERKWEEHFNVRHAVSVNSATSALYSAVGAAGVGPGDQVIVSPFTMTASATCALIYNAIPVFVDVLPDTFCLDPEKLREAITPYTKAIVAVDLFGHPFEADEIMKIAEENGIIVIEDAAQAYGAKYKERIAGTLGHIGVFSLNVHKTINTGEGGICTTNDEDTAERIRLIRNHGEVVVKDKGTENLVNMLGFNYRMCEIEAAIAGEQLKKIYSLVDPRIENAEYLSKRLIHFPGITPPIVKNTVKHGYYAYPVKYDASKVGISRELFARALTAEGIPVNVGYVKPIYLEPLYQKRIGYGQSGCPFSCPMNEGRIASYDKGICPVTERMHYCELLVQELVYKGLSKNDLDDIVHAYE